MENSDVESDIAGDILPSEIMDQINANISDNLHISDLDDDSDCIKSPETMPNNKEDCFHSKNSFLLTDLPLELIFHILSFLESQVIMSLYRTCRKFYELLSDDKYWKRRLLYRWPNSCPVFEREDLNWHKICTKWEDVHKMWAKPEDYFHHFMFKEGFFAAVDVVHLVKDSHLLATGSRDRHLNILDLSKYQCDTTDNLQDLIIYSDDKNHKGWVWSMASHGNTLVTGSWDTHIRMWDLGDGDIRLQNSIDQLKTAILSLHFEPGFIAAGGFNKWLYLLDPRIPNHPVRKKYHTKAILCVAADDKYVLTGSEDEVISIYDRVAGKNLKKITIGSMVMSMSYGGGQLWAGDKLGKLHVLDTKDGLFDENTMQTLDIGYNGRLTGVVHTEGGIFTSCSDGVIKVVENSRHPNVICSLKMHSGEVSRISYSNGVLASAGSDMTVGVWIPKNKKY